jgi:hypothetical protein
MIIGASSCSSKRTATANIIKTALQLEELEEDNGAPAAVDILRTSLQLLLLAGEADMRGHRELKRFRERNCTFMTYFLLCCIVLPFILQIWYVWNKAVNEHRSY